MGVEDTERAVALGRLIRSARWLRGWKQADLARELGVSTATISAVESGDRKRFSREELVRYEEVLGIVDSGLLVTMGFQPQDRPVEPKAGRRSLTYGGASLSPEQEQEIIDYIDWIRTRDQAG